MEVMDWNIYDAGSIGMFPDENFRVYMIYLITYSLSATTNAMMDALKHLLVDRQERCVVGEVGSSILEELE